MMTRTDNDGPIRIGVGMPQWLYLNLYADLILSAFGEHPLLVGSALTTKAWRDVDVRLVLDDDVFMGWFGKMGPAYEHAPKWVSVCMAYAALGKHMTGLPIDFQIQMRSHAQELYIGQKRISLLLPTIHRLHNDDPYR